MGGQEGRRDEGGDGHLDLETRLVVGSVRCFVEGGFVADVMEEERGLLHGGTADRGWGGGARERGRRQDFIITRDTFIREKGMQYGAEMDVCHGHIPGVTVTTPIRTCRNPLKLYLVLLVSLPYLARCPPASLLQSTETSPSLGHRSRTTHQPRAALVVACPGRGDVSSLEETGFRSRDNDLTS